MAPQTLRCLLNVDRLVSLAPQTLRCLLNVDRLVSFGAHGQLEREIVSWPQRRQGDTSLGQVSGSQKNIASDALDRAEAIFAVDLLERANNPLTTMAPQALCCLLNVDRLVSF